VNDSAAPRTDAAPARIAVVAVHGVWMRGASLNILRRRLGQHGFEVHIFNYPSVTADLAANGARLAAFIARVPGDTVHLLGHSLGGVLIAAMLEKHSPARLGRVVCLGPPFAGSRTAERLARLPGGNRLIGRSLGDLLTRGGYGAWRAPQEIGIIAGRVPIGFGQLLGGFREPNDGTVAIAETQLAGAHDHLVMPVAHSVLAWSPRVADQVEHFFRTGRFDRA
jgi:pimeloyl-ACP methyl ester carboxylesterase